MSYTSQKRSGLVCEISKKISMKNDNRHTYGFTLIEMMIAVAVIGILSAIALPSYTRYIAKSNRSAAQAHLVDIAQREQQYFMDSRSYGSKADLKIIDPTNVSGLYDVKIDLPATVPPSFTVTATPISGAAQATASEPTLSIDNAGAKLPVGKW